MNIETKNIWQIRLATFSIFLLGFIAGCFAINAYYVRSEAARPLPTKQERYEESFNQLNLSDEQKSEVQKTVSEIRTNIQQLKQETEPRLQEIRSRNDEKLQKILTPQQWNKFQQLRENIRRQED